MKISKTENAITIKKQSYKWGYEKPTMEFIHRYYLSKKLRAILCPADIGAIHDVVWHEREDSKSFSSVLQKLRGKDCSIIYSNEGLSKTLTKSAFASGLRACMNHYNDCNRRARLTPEDSDYLLKFNEQLRKFEYELRRELAARADELNTDLQAGDTFVQDYEIQTIIRFGLSKDDPWYEDDDDNVLYEYSYGWNPKHHNRDELFDEIDGWNDKRGADNAKLPILQTPHCWLFHELEDHSPIPVHFLRRIGFIWTDIQIWRQRFMDVDKLTAEFRKSSEV